MVSTHLDADESGVKDAEAAVQALAREQVGTFAQFLLLDNVTDG